LSSFWRITACVAKDCGSINIPRIYSERVYLRTDSLWFYRRDLVAVTLARRPT